jgi:hypothetical protein
VFGELGLTVVCWWRMSFSLAANDIFLNVQRKSKSCLTNTIKYTEGWHAIPTLKGCAGSRYALTFLHALRSSLAERSPSGFS